MLLKLLAETDTMVADMLTYLIV